MYKFSTRDDGSSLDIIVTRALLALAGFAAFVVRTDEHSVLNTIAGILLLLLAVFVKPILLQLKVNRLILLSVASLVLVFSTGSLSFGAVLLVYGLLFKFFYKAPTIEINTAGVKVIKMFSTTVHPWSDLNNVILKDGLLTIDFKSNKLMQVVIDDPNLTIDEKAFNGFCGRIINNVQEVSL